MYSEQPAGEPGKNRPASDLVRRWTIALAGDIAAILVFVIIGRSSHHDQGGIVLGTAGTALPFLIGWAAAAAGLRAYAADAFRDMVALVGRVALVWAGADLIALAIRSVLERRLAPVSFAIVSYVSGVVLLSLWRITFRFITRL